MAKNKKQTITGLELKYEALLVYLLSFLGFIFSFMKDEKVSEDARFHYKQSGAIFIIYVALWIVISIINAFGLAMAFASFGLSAIFLGIIDILLGLVELSIFALSIITIVKAFYNEKFEIPVINKLANFIWK